jgi:hypothetical protein
MALNFGLLDQGGPTNFFEGYSQGQEKMQANAMAQQRAAQAQQEFGMRQQEFAAGQAEKKRLSTAAIVTQRTASAREAILNARTPDDARAIERAQHADEYLGPIRRQFGSLEADLADIPNEPTAFNQWKLKQALGAAKFIERMDADAQFAAAMGGAPQTNAMAPAPAPMAMGGAPAAPAPAPAALSPTVQTSIDDLVKSGIPRETITVEDGKIYVGSYGSNVVGEPPIMEKYFTPEGGFAMRPQAPLTPLRVAANQIAPSSVNAMATAPAPAAAAPPSELQRLIDRRDNLSAISDQTPRVKTNIENLNKDIERLSRTKEKINVIGVAKGTGNPVYLDSISDEQYIYVADADGKQKRKLYSGSVDRSTSNVTATANARLPPLESAEQKGKGELNVNLYKVVSDAARLATKTLPALETQAKILDSGFNTGFGTAAQKAGASVLSALGVPEATKFATDAQTFLAATQQAVLQKQLEQKGPQTESDAKRITDTGAQLGNTVDANRFIIDVAKAQFKRDLNQRDFFDKWWAKNKTYEGAENDWFNGEGGKSLFDAPELTKYVASKRSEADAILKRK